MKTSVLKDPVKIIAGYMVFTLLMSPAFSSCVFAGERLEDFSAMIKDIDAEATAPEETKDMDTPRVQETKSAAQSGTAVKSETGTKAGTAPKYESAPKVGTASKTEQSGAAASTGSEPKLTAGAARYMEDASAKGEQAASEKAGTEQAKSGRSDGEEPDERLVEFAALAGTQQGDGEDERLVEFAAIADTGDGSGEDTRLQEFAALADTGEVDMEDARLAEFASISDGVGGSGNKDTRMVSIAKANDRREDMLTKKYGPVIEDHVVADPEKYNDGDKVVASSEDYPAGDRIIAKAQDYNDGDRVVATAKAHYSTDGTAAAPAKAKRDTAKAQSSEDTQKDKTENRSGFSKRLESARAFFRDLFSKKKGNDDNGVDNGGYDAPDSYDGEKQSLGYFNLTAYDACILCCGKTDGITATGTKAQAGRTVAVDPAVIPYGSKIMINGHIYIAEDTGSKINGNTIDVFMNTHEEAKKFGRKSAEVFLLK